MWDSYLLEMHTNCHNYKRLVSPNSIRRFYNQIRSHKHAPIALNSTFVELLATTFYLFDFWLIKFWLRNTQQPVTYLLVSKQLSEALSEYPCNWSFDDLDMKIPFLGDVFRYFNTLKATSKWCWVSLVINWDKTCTTLLMSSLVKVWYISLPISYLYKVGSSNNSSLSWLSLWFISMGVVAPLTLSNPFASMRYNAFFFLTQHQSFTWSGNFNPKKVYWGSKVSHLKFCVEKSHYSCNFIMVLAVNHHIIYIHQQS